jgi:hypothetical protein
MAPLLALMHGWAAQGVSARSFRPRRRKPAFERVEHNLWGNSGLAHKTHENTGRSERIRTSDPVVPNDVRYQAALHSETSDGRYITSGFHACKSFSMHFLIMREKHLLNQPTPYFPL